MNKITLKEIIEYQKGAVFKSQDYQKQGVGIVRVSDFEGNSINLDNIYYISNEIADKNKKVRLKPYDVVITTVGATAGNFIRVPIEADGYLLNQNTVRLRTKENNKWDQIYLFYALKYKNFQEFLLLGAQGSAQPSIVLDQILDAEIAYPDNRREIAKKLFSIDQKIQLNTQINQTLEQIAQVLFKSWFVNFDPVRAKAKALSDGLSLEQAELTAMQAISGKQPEELTALSQTQPERYAELTEIAKAFPCEMVKVDGVEVPRGWEVKELGSLMTIKRGGSPRPIKDFISDKGLNWVKISDATAEDNPFLFSTKEYIKSEGLSKTVLLNKGSLILSNSATPGLPRFLELDACIHDGWLYFSDIKRLTQEYLYFFFLNIRNDLVAQGNGSVFTNLKTDIVKAQKAIVPDERVICYFDKQVKSIMNLIRYNTANSISLKETRDLLLPKLLNGGV